MKKTLSKEIVSTATDDTKLCEDQDLKINEKMEEQTNFDSESKIETQEEEQNNEERDLNRKNLDSSKSIRTLETKNSKYIGEVNEINKKHGIGVCYYSNGDKYIGQFNEGKKQGVGKFILSNGEIFQGEFNEDTLDGFLEHIGKNSRKQGFAKKFQFQQGEILLSKGENYNYSIEGNFDVENQNLGTGKMKNPIKNLFYEGEMLNFISNGYGISTVKDKFTFQGSHANGKFTGYGEVFNPDGSKFFGNFKNNLREGYSVAFCKDGRLSFGKYCNDLRTGPFIVSNKNTTRIELWNNGFKSKLIEKIDTAKTYFKTFYPEFDWINKINLKNITDIYAEVKCEEYCSYIPNAPPLKTRIITNEEEKKIELTTNESMKNDILSNTDESIINKKIEVRKIYDKIIEEDSIEKDKEEEDEYDDIEQFN